MKRISIALLCLLCCFALAVPGLADLGGFSGDSDYGGGSYDYDYDSGYSGSSSGDGFLMGILFSGLLDSPVGIVIAVILVAFYFYRRSRRGSAHARRPVTPGGQRTDAATLLPMQNYSQLDPNFDPAELTQKLSNWYVQMQNQWTAGDMTPLRPFFTDALYAQFDRQLDSMKQQNLVNYVERISVLGVDLRGFRQRGGEDHIIAEIRTRIVDYTVNKKTGEVVSGSRTQEKFMTYEWDLTRPSGQTTTQEAELQKVNCPNCGAPLSINESSKCPYCDTVVTLEQHDWVVCAIRGISQQTM